MTAPAAADAGAASKARATIELNDGEATTPPRLRSGRSYSDRIELLVIPHVHIDRRWRLVRAGAAANATRARLLLDLEFRNAGSSWHRTTRICSTPPRGFRTSGCGALGVDAVAKVAGRAWLVYRHFASVIIGSMAVRIPVPATGSYLAAHWWAPLLRGIVAIAFGVLLLARPIAGVAAFVILFGAFAFVDGILTIVQALRYAHPQTGQWWWLLLQGLCGAGIGVITFFNPGITAYVLGIFIGAWAIVTGIFEIAAAIQMRRNVPGEIFMILAGILSIVLGAGIFLFPGAGLLAVVWFVAVYALAAGIALVILALRLRGLGTAAT